MKRQSSYGYKAFYTGIVIASALMMATPVTAQAQEDNPLIVEADDSLQWLRNEKQYIATGNAVAKQGDLTLNAQVITAEYISDNTADGDHDATNITFIKGEQAAMLTRATLKATADVIEYDITTEFVKIFGGSPLIVNGQDTLSSSDTITYDRTTRRIIAIGNAKVKMENGQQLNGDVITVVITKDESDIETVTADGNALVISPADNGERRAKANKMVYTSSDGIAILTGAVRIQDGSNILTGDRAEVNTINGTSTMSSNDDGKRVSGVFKQAE